MSKKLISIREAAKRLGVTRQRVWQFVLAGRLAVERSPDFPRLALVHAESVESLHRSDNGVHLQTR